MPPEAKLALVAAKGTTVLPLTYALPAAIATVLSATAWAVASSSLSLGLVTAPAANSLAPIALAAISTAAIVSRARSSVLTCPSVISALPTALKVARPPNPRLVRPVAAVRPVAPPSHLSRSV